MITVSANAMLVYSPSTLTCRRYIESGCLSTGWLIMMLINHNS